VVLFQKVLVGNGKRFESRHPFWRYIGKTDRFRPSGIFGRRAADHVDDSSLKIEDYSSVFLAGILDPHFDKQLSIFRIENAVPKKGDSFDRAPTQSQALESFAL